MKQLRVLLLPPGGDASPSEGYPRQYVAGTHLYTWVERDNVGKVSCLRKQHDGRDWASNHRPSDLKGAWSRGFRRLLVKTVLKLSVVNFFHAQHCV